jgi:hypothetical protein
MEKILQHAQHDLIPSEGVNPISKHVVLHRVSIVQDALTSTETIYLKALVRLGGAPDRFNNRIAVAGTAQLMQESGLSRSTVKRCKKRLRANGIIEVMEREDPFSHKPQTVKINSFKSVLHVWRQNKWTQVIRNRGVQFATEGGDLIAMKLPLLPELVKRVVDAAMAAVHKIASPRRKPYAAPVLNADAVREAATVADGMWKAIQEELRPRILPKRFEMWIKPLQGWDLKERVLYVRTPSPQFGHVGSEFDSEITAAVETLKLDVKLLRFDHGPPG